MRSLSWNRYRKESMSFTKNFPDQGVRNVCPISMSLAVLHGAISYIFQNTDKGAATDIYLLSFEVSVSVFVWKRQSYHAIKN